MRQCFLSVSLLALAAVVLVGCASGPRSRVMDAVEQRDSDKALVAYERYRELDGPDGELLGYVAGVVLENAALSDDDRLRDTAIRQLALSGTMGRPILERVANEGAPRARAGALEVLARRGDERAEDYLYAMLDSDDAQVRAAAIQAVDAERQTDRLIAWLEDTAGVVRKAAAIELADAAPDTEARLALAEAARVDPLPSVRSAAARALGSYGSDAIEDLRNRLGDPESSVRMAAVRAIVRADRERGVRALRPLLSTQPSPAGVEAARVIALTGRRGEGSDGDGSEAEAEGVTDARAYLRRALASGSPRIRSQAGIALTSLPADPSLDEALREALEGEQDDEVRLQLARAMLQRHPDDEAAVTALERVMQSDREMAAVQAASMLAERGDDAALARLRETLESDDALLRRVAARALARDAMRPDDVRGLLDDDDAIVRLYAAGGILAAASHA